MTASSENRRRLISLCASQAPCHGSRCPVSPEVEALGARVVDAAFAVHKGVGVGCKESAYARAFEVALFNRGLRFDRERILSLHFEGHVIERIGAVDFVVEDTILVELKAVEFLLPTHFAQTMTYLRASRLPLAFLVNFHEPFFKAGIHRRTPDSRWVTPER